MVSLGICFSDPQSSLLAVLRLTSLLQVRNTAIGLFDATLGNSYLGSSAYDRNLEILASRLLPLHGDMSGKGPVQRGFHRLISDCSGNLCDNKYIVTVHEIVLCSSHPGQVAVL